MADSVNYDLLTSQDEFGIVQNQLRTLESQHYALYVSMLGSNTDNPQLDTLATTIAAVQQEYERVKNEVDSANSDGTTQAASS